MARAGPRKLQRYSLEFKRKAVQLSQLDGVQVQAVAESLAIHPFMLSNQYSRRVLAWRLAAVRDTRLTGAVVRAALRRRRPAIGLIFHSDRGSEYLGAAFRHRLAARGVRQSMTRGGAPGENPHIESFFPSCKADVVHGRAFETIGDLRRTLHWYLPFYNHRRLHSALGYRSPVDYERRAA